MKIAVVSTVKATLSELEILLAHYRYIGVDRFFLYFDDPRDPGLAEFEADGWLQMTSCDDRHWGGCPGGRPSAIERRQEWNATQALNLAREDGCEWIIHIDSDELVWSERPIRQALSKTDAGVVRFAVREAVSDREQFDSIFEPALFKVPTHWLKVKLAGLLGCRRSIYHGRYFRGHLTSKAAVRIRDNIVDLGIHGPDTCPGDLTVIFNAEILLLHFDCIGFENWCQKWGRRADNTAFAQSLRDNRLKQFRAFADAQRAGDTALHELYRRLHVIPRYERWILQKLGMLERHSLPHIQQLVQRKDAFGFPRSGGA